MISRSVENGHCLSEDKYSWKFRSSRIDVRAIFYSGLVLLTLDKNLGLNMKSIFTRACKKTLDCHLSLILSNLILLNCNDFISMLQKLVLSHLIQDHEISDDAVYKRIFEFYEKAEQKTKWMHKRSSNLAVRLWFSCNRCGIVLWKYHIHFFFLRNKKFCCNFRFLQFFPHSFCIMIFVVSALSAFLQKLEEHWLGGNFTVQMLSAELGNPCHWNQRSKKSNKSRKLDFKLNIAKST